MKDHAGCIRDYISRSLYNLWAVLCLPRWYYV